MKFQLELYEPGDPRSPFSQKIVRIESSDSMPGWYRLTLACGHKLVVFGNFSVFNGVVRCQTCLLRRN